MNDHDHNDYVYFQFKLGVLLVIMFIVGLICLLIGGAI